MKKEEIQDAGQYLAMGAMLTIFFYVVFAFAPALMLSLSITDMMFDWEVEVDLEGLTLETYVYTEPVEPYDDFGKVCMWFVVIFIICIVIQKLLTINIKETWPIIIGWWILSIHPFYYWFIWMCDADKGPFPGVNWFPW